MINLVKDTINNADIDSLIEWLKTYPRLTKGLLTVELEEKWAKYVGVKYATFVNSGSSANLMALYCLLEIGKIKRNDKVIVPAVSWATDLSPVFQLGLDPVLCDINLNDLSVDIKELEKIILEQNPKVLMLVHVLGLVCDIESIKNLCDKYKVILIEDTCESVGSKFKDKVLGSFGDISTFSFYFGHHISTIEGGMLCTNDPELNNLFKSLRNHGWDRDWDTDTKLKMRTKYGISEFDSLYTFYYNGFNFRSTDLQAYIGLQQLKKVDAYCDIRNQNYKLYHFNIKNSIWKPTLSDTNFISNFAWPIISEKRDFIIANLRKNDVECRPLICGSMGRQPFYIKNKGEYKLTNADIVHKNGMYVPNHQDMTVDEVIKICDIINNS
jgi:CDP-6-deoxy-D-xylo-4-hexulose-3-dehydrase